MVGIIQDKTSIADAVQETFGQVISFIEQQDAAHYHRIPEDRGWSTAQQLDHLIRSTTPLNNGLRMPKMALRTMFGICERTERSYDELKAVYQKMLADGGRALGRYVPKDKQEYPKAASLEKFRKEGEQLVEIIQQWKEERLSKHQIPHPIIGKLTIREMLFFTIFHTHHHLEALNKSYLF